MIAVAIACRDVQEPAYGSSRNTVTLLDSLGLSIAFDAVTSRMAIC